MSLNEVLAALANNTMLNIEITKKEGTDDVPIIEFEASGYEALSAELLVKEVESITVGQSVSRLYVSILLKEDNEAVD